MRGCAMSDETTYILTTDEVDEINLQISEVLAMAEVLEAASADQAFELQHLNTYAGMLEERVEAVQKSFKQATAKDKQAA